jgi:hypothetical protein
MKTDDLKPLLRTVGAVLARAAIRMVATFPWLSIYLATFTVLDYLLNHDASDAAGRFNVVLVGVVGGILVWFVSALLTNETVLPDRANPRSFTDLSSRVVSAREDLNRFSLTATVNSEFEKRLKELSHRLDPANRHLDSGWSSGMAYVMLWRELHSIEEDLVAYAPDSELDAALSHVMNRVDGSELDRKGSPVQDQITDVKSKMAAKTYDSVRPLLRQIRAAVDDYRDRRFEALVRSREDVDREMVLLGITAWALLSLAILQGAPAWAIGSVAAFYLVGVAAGLLTQLQGNTLSRSVEDIYGYGRAQVRKTLLLSGLAGVGGVAVSWVAAQTPGPGLTAGDLTAAFSVTPAAFMAAAVFGLTPGLLIDRLNVWAKANLVDLASTLPNSAPA